MSSWTLLIVVLSVPETLGHCKYKARIPNGDNVPHPCKANVTWQGVGHKWFGGGGARNPFGEDFDNNNRTWTPALCRLDSDGDGLTNGQELGDPDCVWTPSGSTKPRTSNISHPGVCTPWGEGECNSTNYGWVCNEFNCDYINAADVRNITIRFPRTKVPAEETNYYCFNFHLPTDQEYHMIATKPLINNSDVMHHMILTSCEGTVGLIKEPQDCIMGTPSCSRAMGIWTVGMTGECIDPQAGFRIGKEGTGTVSLQVHWNNPTKNDTWYDSSGLILYYTAKLRKYDAATFSVGQTDLPIPPRMTSVVHQGTCTARCTNKIFKGPVHVVSSLNHMHNLGIRQNLTLTRPGMAPLTIMDDNPFSFDLPVSHEPNYTLIIKPGDELQTYCTYKSLSRNKTTLFGASTYDEMCFSYLTFFPAENITESSCIQWQDTDLCDVTGNDCFDGSLFNVSDPHTSAMIEKILAHCNPYGGCRVECPAAIQDILREKPCLRKYWGFLATTFFSMNDAKLLKFVTAVESCGFANRTVMTPTTCSGVLNRVDMKFFAPLIALIFWTYL